MKRILTAVILFCASAFAAEVQFYFVPTGICPFGGTPNPICAAIVQGGTLVWITPSADLQNIGTAYSITSQFTVLRPDGTNYTATITGNTKSDAWETANKTMIPLWVGGWAPADTEYVTVTSITVTADTGKFQVSKAVKNPAAAETY